MDEGTDDRFAPIRHHLELPVSHARAFDSYVHGIGEWWHPRWTANGNNFDTVTIDAQPGGSIVECARDGNTITWGEVTELEPGRLIVHSYWLAHEGDPSIVRVSFTNGEHGGTAVDFEHAGWNESNASAREQFTHWPVLLRRFAEHANHV